MSENILFRFANEEMIYLLRSLNIADFPGMTPEPLKQLSDEEKLLLMATVDHTLRARGLVLWDGETTRQIDPLVITLLLECAHPDFTLFVDLLDTTTGAARLLYIFGSEAIVEQCEVEPQVQQYLRLPSHEAALQRLQALLLPERNEALEGTAATLPIGQLSMDLWQEALKVARAGESGAATLLARSLPNLTAEALAEALHAFQRICYLGRWKQTPSSEEDQPDAALTVVIGGKQLFLLWQEKPGGLSLTVMSASVEQIKAYLARLLPPERSTHGKRNGSN